VKDPRSGRFFRFGDLERFIAEQLDGATPLDVVRHRTETRFGASLPADVLAGFVRSLERSGLVEGQDAVAGHPRGRMRGSLFYLRFRVFDPDRLLDRLVRRVRFCYTPQFLICSAAIIVFATALTIVGWSELRADLSRLYRLSSIPLFLLLSLGLASAHELAHGLTCKRFGGEVHELGFLLIYFTPSFYTNVSDAWLFPEKAKRLWVGFAGPYFEVFLWALATLAWRVTDVDTWINYAALLVMTLSGVKTLFNLNPFIKLDGYYLLSDYLELPNLRKRSFRYVGRVVKRLTGRRERIVAEVSARERWIYLAYGLVGSVTSLTILGYVVVTAGGYLIDTHQSWALLVFAGLTGSKSRRKLRKLFGGAARPDDPEDDGDIGDGGADTASPPENGTDPAAPARATGPSPSPSPSAPRPGWSPQVKWTALTAAVAVVAVVGRLQLRIGGPVTVLPEQNADVRAQVEGFVEEILADEGDTVRAGDVFARLSNPATVAELRKTEASIEDTRAQLKKAENGPAPEEVTLNEVSVARVEDRFRSAQENGARLTRLFETGAATRQELQAAQDQLAAAQHDRDDARGRFAMLYARIRPEDLQSARAKLAALEHQQRFLAGEVRALTVVSPADGIVATPSRQLREMRGQLVPQGALIAKVYDFRTVRAQLIVSEKDIADVHVGQPVALRARAYPDVAFRGTVTAVAIEVTPASAVQTTAGGTSSSSSGSGGANSTSNSSGSPRTFVVTTRIDNHDLLLKPGMTGQGKIYAGQRRISGLITRRLARTFKVEFWSWW
jgi:multidrug resistance efflux pump